MFGAGKKSVRLFRSRLSMVPHVLKRTVSETKGMVSATKSKISSVRESRQEAAAEKSGRKITQPRSGWRDKLAASVQGKSGALATWGKNITASIPTTIKIGKVSRESAAPPVIRQQPKITLIDRQATPAEKPEFKPESPAVASEPAQKYDAQEVNETSSRLTSFLGKRAKKEDSKSAMVRAAAALAAGRLSEVEDILVPYLAEHSDDKHAYMILGRAAVMQNNWDEAIEIFQQVIKIDDGTKGAQAYLGHAALQSGHLTLALQSLQRAHEQEPDNIDVLKNLLKIAQRQDNKVLKKVVVGQLKELKKTDKVSPAADKAKAA